MIESWNLHKPTGGSQGVVVHLTKYDSRAFGPSLTNTLYKLYIWFSVGCMLFLRLAVM